MYIGDFLMTVYLDLVAILNYYFDILILLTVNITLKRNVSLGRILLGGIIGEVSLLSIFIKNGYFFIIFKFFLAILLCVVTFKFKDIFYTFNNLMFFYMVSIILAGYMYYLRINSISYFGILFLVPLIFLLYIKQSSELKLKIEKTVPVKIVFPNKRSVNLLGYVDTGNKLRDPITKKWVVLVNRKMLKGVIRIRTPIYVSYKSLNNHGLVECIRASSLIIKNKEYSNFLVGLMDNNLMINSNDCILNMEIMEELNV